MQPAPSHSHVAAGGWWRWSRWVVLALIVVTGVFRRIGFDPIYAWTVTIIFFIVLGTIWTRSLRFSLATVSTLGLLIGGAVGLGAAVVTFLIEWRFHLFFALITDTIISGLVGLLITSATHIFLLDRGAATPKNADYKKR